MNKKIKIKALLITPKDKVFFKNIDLSSKKDSDVIVKWHISSVCNSERRRYNLTKSKDDKESFIGGHEVIGSIIEENYPRRTYALLPHSNCLTRNENNLCISCENGNENLCLSMRHAGLDNGEPSGFSDMMSLTRSQLLEVSELDLHLAPFLEPLSCVIRSWRISKINISSLINNIGIIGGGPIGCLHAFYVNKINNKTKITIVESNASRVNVLKEVFKGYDNVVIKDNSIDEKFDVTVMAASSSSAFNESIRLLKPKGKCILFSGFNTTTYKEDNYLPEIIHRNEFTHFANNKILIGSSGYTEKDLLLSKSALLDFEDCKNIVTGKVYGLDSNEIHKNNGVIEKYDEPILVKDIKGDFYESHIKIQYFNNLYEKPLN